MKMKIIKHVRKDKLPVKVNALILGLEKLYKDKNFSIRDANQFLIALGAEIYLRFGKGTYNFEIDHFGSGTFNDVTNKKALFTIEFL